MCYIVPAMKFLSARFPSLLVELSTVDIFFQCVTCLVLFSFVWGCIARLLCSWGLAAKSGSHWIIQAPNLHLAMQLLTSTIHLLNKWCLLVRYC